MSTSTARCAPSSSQPWWKVSDWWYLVYLSMLAFQPVFDPDSGTFAWVVTGVAALVFVAFYVADLRRPASVGRFGAPLCLLLGVLVFPVNGGASVFFIYAAAFAASYSSRQVAMRWFAGLSAALLGLAFIVADPWTTGLWFSLVPLFFIWVIGFTVLADVERSQEADRLRIDNARIEHLATAAERDRISRDLHDLIGQSLTEVIVRAQLVRRLVGQDPARASAEAAEIEHSSRRALDEVRAAVRGWREVRIDEELEVAQRALDAAEVAVVIDRDHDFDPPPTTETVLALALREAVTNVVRHAGAASCAIALRRHDGRDVLEVVDDGRGGDPAGLGGSAAEGSGLTGMRERVLALGGDVEVADADGRRVTVRLPAGIPA